MRQDANFNIKYENESPESVDERLAQSATLLPTIAAGIQLQVDYEQEITPHGSVKHKMRLSLGHRHAYLVATNHHKDRNVSCNLQDPAGNFGKHYSHLHGNQPWTQLARKLIKTLIIQTEVSVAPSSVAEEVEA